jgi:DNA-binding transcriptional LysR family regulator
MHLSLEALQVLDAIDRKGSFAAAAEELFRVPSAITYSVQQLEQDMEVQLFDRSGHRAKLTEAGQELLTEGRHLLRAATDLECRVKQVAKGWEAELRIAVDTIIGPERLYGIIDEFYLQNSGTRLKLLTEVLAGNWDALLSGRADLVIGASGDAPASGGFATRALGRVEFDFVAAPAHPICREPEPIGEATILAHRAVTVADSSRNLPPRTVGLLSGQDVLTVPSMHAKIAAHVAGLGVGFLPHPIAQREAAAGRLRILKVTVNKPEGPIMIAWRPANAGNALKWFLNKLDDAALIAALVG